VGTKFALKEEIYQGKGRGMWQRGGGLKKKGREGVVIYSNGEAGERKYRMGKRINQ